MMVDRINNDRVTNRVKYSNRIDNRVNIIANNKVNDRVNNHYSWLMIGKL